MADYDEAGYYELQLNNKQLVFFFMAAVAIGVVVFLCGVMVGRGVRDATLAAAGTDVAAISGSSPATGGGLTPADVRLELDYQKRLESSEVDDELEEDDPLEEVSSSPEKLVAGAKKRDSKSASTASVLKQEPEPAPPAKQASSQAGEATPARLVGSEQGTFSIQVVALKTREAADKVVRHLLSKGYRAYLEEGGESGLHRVRVGRFDARSDAERVAQRLRDIERFNPYITQ